MIGYAKKQGKLLSNSLRFAFSILVVMWIIHAVQWMLGISLYEYGGLFPRKVFGLKGILASPWLHGSWEHLMSNSAPLLVLLVMISFFYRKVSNQAIFWIYLLTGLLVWIFGRPVFHIGASGVVYGLVSFVFWSGIFVKNIRSVVLALIVAVLYSGMFLGILPNEEGISWESHLIGGLVGILVAYLLRQKMKRLHNEPKKVFKEEEPPTYYFDRDTFSR